MEETIEDIQEEQQRQWLVYDITNLGIAIHYLENVLNAINDVENFNNNEYEKITNTIAYIESLKMKKEIELERLCEDD